MKSLDFEKHIGIEIYFTKEPGIGGKLRSLPEDFIVNEIFSYPTEKENGNFTIAEIYSKNWENNGLVRELSKRLHISRKRISFAGTKDKRACSTQLMSFYKVTRDKLSNIKIKDVEIKNIFSSDKPIKIGDLYGNKFEITLKNINKDVKPKQIQNTISYLEENCGFPNFYGVQRFGIMRPITHIVGKYIINGDFKKAIMSYIANPIKGENEDTYKLRDELEKSHDFSKALKSYPPSLNFEKAILNKLVIDPEDFVGALKELPKNLLIMFVNAYQSYLFNRILSERIRRKIPLNKAIVGDIVLPIRNNIVDYKGVLVNESNIEKVNRQVSKNHAFTSGILLGSDSVFSMGEMGEIEYKIIENEKVDYRNFIIPSISYLSSSGSRRPLLAVLNKIYWKLNYDKLNGDKQDLILKFELQKGCYATSLLREFMKSEYARNY
jgi:tRNA pseudouridine13 synthase